LLCTGLYKDEGFLKPFNDLLLKDEERKDIMARYPRQERRRLQTMWGFTGLLEQTIRSGEGLGPSTASLLHGYAMSSHVAHADFQGVGMVMEREFRNAARRNAANRAHAARIISDQLSFCALRLMTGYRFIGENIETVLNLIYDKSELWTKLSEAQRVWYRVEYGVELDSVV
jgi:hypothetical protein